MKNNSPSDLPDLNSFKNENIYFLSEGVTERLLKKYSPSKNISSCESIRDDHEHKRVA